jgi:hypothetical protein
MIKSFTSWQFYDYMSDSGRIPFVEWLGTIPRDAHAFIDNRLLAMERLKKWSDKWASDYKGRDKIIELRITFKKVQYRPLGTYQPGYKFVLLKGAIEKGGKIPRADLDSAEQHRDRLLKEGNCVIPHLYED